MNNPNILIVKLSALGDVVHTLPALNALRRYYPKAHIAWLVEEAAVELLQNHPALDLLLVSRRKTWIEGVRSTQWRQHAREMVDFVRCLRRRYYDMVFDFQTALKGAALIALVRGGRKIGFGPGLPHQELSYLVLNERIPAISAEVHALEQGMIMLEAAGIPSGPIEYQLPIRVDHCRMAAGLLSEGGIRPDQPFVVINPMAKWETKLWQQHKFAQVADCIRAEFNLPVVFTGGPDDQAYIHTILARMKTKALILSGRTDLMTLAAVLQRAALMITTDTGPMHIAAALGTPTVALFGPTSPGRTGPYGAGHRVLRADWACSPCFKRRCSDAAACMASISVEQVMAATADLLGISGAVPEGQE
jgi:heptosyltransferase I